MLLKNVMGTSESPKLCITSSQDDNLPLANSASSANSVDQGVAEVRKDRKNHKGNFY
jgi:hypothetical protein